MVKIVLDVYELNEQLVEQAAAVGVEMRVLEEVGPAGGCPEVEFSGDRERVEQFVREDYLGGDPVDVDFYLEMIEEVIE